MNNAALDLPTLAHRRDELGWRISDLRGRASLPTEDSLDRFMKLDADFQVLADESRARLLGTRLAWSEDDRRELAWLRHANDDLAVIGFTLSMAFGEHRGFSDDRTQRLMARTFVNMGHVTKWEVAVTRGAPHDFSKPHRMLLAAMRVGAHAMPLAVRHGSDEVACTLESLYFRALLLARFSSGALNMKQLEIMDAWMWLWMPALQGVEACPSEAALRADLDSSEGLRRGPRADAGPTLYLPPQPIEEAYRAIVGAFHAGRVVPSTGAASEFAVEEYVAVLELIRKGLGKAASAPVNRAERRATSHVVELFVGLNEVMTRGLAPPRRAPSVLALATVDGMRTAARREDTAQDSIYERTRRMVRVANVSDSGFGIEGSDRDLGSVAPGDLVALRLEFDGPLEICKVARCVPAGAAGRVWLGVRRICARAQLLDVKRREAKNPLELGGTIAFVPGEDRSGRHDACLVSEREFAEGTRLESMVGERVYSYRFNRARDRGRGWVLAGFEMLAAGNAPD